MQRRCNLLTAEHDPVINESDEAMEITPFPPSSPLPAEGAWADAELIRILATVIRKSDAGSWASLVLEP